LSTQENKLKNILFENFKNLTKSLLGVTTKEIKRLLEIENPSDPLKTPQIPQNPSDPLKTPQIPRKPL
jgi:hypothetical protein